MGVVYEGRDLRTDSRVAVKVLDQPRSLRTRQTNVRFHREAKTAMVITSPHVTRVLEHGEDKDMLFLVMEYLEGEDLQQVLAKADTLPPAVALRIAAQACAGLVSAHERGVMHRDIKPANLFLAREGDGLIVKLVDFGIAKIWIEELRTRDSTSVTHTGSLVGSPAYMSPEQARGTRRIDARTDLWSLGVVLYRSLSGRIPHQDVEGFGELIMAICSDPPPPLRVIAPWVPADVDALVTRALQIDPAARFPTAAAMLEAITRLVPDGTDLRPSQIIPWEVTDEMKSKAREFATSTVPNTTTGNRHVVIRPPSTPDTESLSMMETVDSSPSGSLGVTQQPMVSAPGPAVVIAPSPPTDPAKGLRVSVAWRIALLGIAALAIVAAFVLWPKQAPVAPVTSVAPVVSSSPAPPVTGQAIVDLPAPKGCNAASVDEYQAGLKALRDSQWDDAHLRFKRAVERDPACPEAQLRLVLTGSTRYSLPERREVYRKAVDLRPRLSPRDQQFLDALGPVVQLEPPDEKAAAMRLLRLAADFPHDAEIVYLESLYTGFGPADLPFKIQMAEKAIALDPKYADAWQMLGNALNASGRRKEAIAALDECLRVAPSSADCASSRVKVLLRVGRCEDALAAMRARPGLTLDSADSYLKVAAALISADSPPERVEEALRRRWARLTPDKSWENERYDRALVSVYRGEFDRAEQYAREIRGKVESAPDLSLRSAYLLIEILLETSRRKEAGDLTSALFKRTAGWEVRLDRDAESQAQFYLEPLLLRAGRSTGQSRGHEWQTRQGGWVESAKRLEKLPESEVWALGTALLTETPEEAQEALKSAPPSALVTDDERSPLSSAEKAFVGHMLLLAGEADKAFTFLRAATASCDALSYPIGHMHAHLWKGQALEQRGDKDGACAAYAVILRRWGRASPPSATAETARRRASDLKCPP